MTVIYEKLISEIEVLLQLYINNQRIISSTTLLGNLHSILEAMKTLRQSRDTVIVSNIIKKVSGQHENMLYPVRLYIITFVMR